LDAGFLVKKPHRRECASLLRTSICYLKAKMPAGMLALQPNNIDVYECYYTAKVIFVKKNLTECAYLAGGLQGCQGQVGYEGLARGI
jgi:hypothetical protein